MFSPAEQQLVRQCLAGHRGAQERLYRQYADAMYNICHRMTAHAGEAEDVLQDAFIEVFRNLDRFRGESTLGAWIKRIVVNHCINAMKRKRIEFAELREHHAEVPEPDHTDEAELALSVARVREAILDLPDGYRQVLTLYLLEGYDHGEIASILGIGEAGSKSQYSRARARLREIMKSKQPAL